MSLPASLRNLFGRSTDRPPSPSQSLSRFAAIGPRAKAPCMCIVGNTGSMEPALKTGTLYMVQPYDFSSLTVGMVVVVWWEGQGLNVCHRILAKKVAGNGETYFLTKGDANALRDAYPLTKDVFVGVAVFGSGLAA